MRPIDQPPVQDGWILDTPSHFFDFLIFTHLIETSMAIKVFLM